MRTARGLAAAVAVLVLAACGPSPIPACDAARDHAVCGFANPEDLARVPGSRDVLVIEHGGAQARAGFSVIDGQTLDRQPLDWAGARQAGAGDPLCPGPPAVFSPGGIDVRMATEGLHVMAVNRATPPRIEFFNEEARPGGKALVWAGCVPVPAGLFLNDVAALPDGGFVATHMVDPAAARSALAPVRFFLGFATGRVVRWSRSEGWRDIAGSAGSFPNGIAASRDGSVIYFAETFGEAVNRLVLATGERRRLKLAIQADNLTWTEDGRLVVVGHAGLPLVTTRGCRGIKAAGCGFSFAVLRLEPDLRTAETIYRSTGEEIPGASTALLVEQTLFLGTAFGDRVTRLSVATPSAQTPPISR